MDDGFYPRLCGGTFFCLLVQFKRQRVSARNTANKKSDGLSEPKMLADLIHVADPSYERPEENVFKSHASRYKSCSISSNTYLPFDKQDFVNRFDKAIKENYDEVILSMEAFCNFYLVSSSSTPPNPSLFNALVNLIAEDKSIADTDNVCIQPNGSFLNKLGISSLSRVQYQPFLLGIWHFIVVNRPNNIIGKETYNSWYPPSSIPGAKREFRSNIGEASGNGVVPEHYSVRSLLNKLAKGLKKAPIISSHEYDYSSYMTKIYDKYKELKTVLYYDLPQPFYSFYVCNDLIRLSRTSMKPVPSQFAQIRDADIIKLLRLYSKHIIITGTGGIGKSMMLKHFLLDSIKKYKTNRFVPFFIALKDFDVSFDSLMEYIMKCIESLCDVTKNQFISTLINGDALFLLDGLDEINSAYATTFEKYLDKFIDMFPQNIFIISSRRYHDFIEYQHFTILDVLPFRKEQALELVDKLEFREDEPDIKQKFRKRLDDNLYRTHTEFANNPLLLTIMLMSFEQFAEVPSKMHIFYREAFDTLAKYHDARKGAYKRQFQTGLTVERFSDYLAEFCARTYYDEKFEFTKDEFIMYFTQVKEAQEKKEPSENIQADQFLADLQDCLCLIYFETPKYYFTHRSFQEYFCALYFSKQKDRTLGNIGNFFESQPQHMQGDETFGMLYDMIPEKVKEYIFKPFLSKLFDECDRENGYWTFLEKIHPTLTYYYNLPYESLNRPISFLTRFIANLIGDFENSSLHNLPYYEEFVVETYAEAEGNGHTELVELNSVDTREWGWFSEPIGYKLSLEVSELLADRERYAEALQKLNAEDCILKKEYNKVREYYRALSGSTIISRGDFFSQFQ